MNRDFLQMFSASLYHFAVTNTNVNSTYSFQYHFQCRARSSSLALLCLTTSPSSHQCLLPLPGQKELSHFLPNGSKPNTLIEWINLHVSTGWTANRLSKEGNCNYSFRAKLTVSPGGQLVIFVITNGALIISESPTALLLITKIGELSTLFAECW